MKRLLSEARRQVRILEMEKAIRGRGPTSQSEKELRGVDSAENGKTPESEEGVKKEVQTGENLQGNRPDRKIVS